MLGQRMPGDSAVITALVPGAMLQGFSKSGKLTEHYFACLRCLGEHDIHRECAPGDLEDRHAAEEVGELLGVQRG